MNKSQGKVNEVPGALPPAIKKTPNQLDRILDQAIAFMADGEKEIHEVRAYARREYDDLEKELIHLKTETAGLIISVDKLYQVYDLNRKKLINTDTYSERELLRLQQETEELRVRLEIEKDKESTIIRRRNDLEIQLRSTKDLNDRAEKLSADFHIAVSLLNGDIKKMTDTIEDINNKQALGIKILQIQEEERRRIAREMHDGLAQQLSRVLINAELSAKMLDKDINLARRELNSLKLELRDSIGSIRRLIYDLRPMSLDDLGLFATIKRDVEVFQKNNPTQNVQLFLTDDLEKKSWNMSETVMLTVYRIFQEALANIQKHSRAKNVRINMKTERNTLLIEIEDDGIGLPRLATARKAVDHGFGLSIMKERVDLLRGEINIQSVPGAGTQIQIGIPLIQAAEKRRKDE